MDITGVSPASWEYRILSPVLSRDFADAMTTLGWRPFFASDASDAALVLIRRWPVPGLRGWTAQAQVYVNHGYPTFVRELAQWLDDERVGSAVFGDHVWPLPKHLRNVVPRMQCIEAHRVVHDVRPDDPRPAVDTGPAAQQADAMGVSVTEILRDDDLQDFLDLDRTAAVFPAAFFRRILRSLVPSRRATFLVAHADGRPVAGGLFLNSARSMACYHGVVAREGAVALDEGGVAVLRRALQLAREREIPYVEHGPADDAGRTLGGHVHAIATGELVFSRAKHTLHHRVLRPAWKRLQPLYGRVLSATVSSAGWVVAFGV